MTRFYVTATYRTAGGNLGQCSFAVMAPDMDHAKQLAARRVSIRGRSKFNITIHRGE
jgi:hypothetical protein